MGPRLPGVERQADARAPTGLTTADDGLTAGTRRRDGAERGSLLALVAPIPFHYCTFVQLFAQPCPSAPTPTHSFRREPFYSARSSGGKKVYAYTVDGQRDASADFDLDNNNSTPNGTAHANGRLYVTNPLDDKVYAYTVDGRRDASADFDLDNNNADPNGITHANGRLYVTDRGDDKVYAYTVDGRRDASADFDLDDNNSSPNGIAHANGRLYVADSSDDKVYAYTVDGRPIGDNSPDEADDHGDTFDTATSVSIPSTTPGELEEGKEDGDRDYFRVAFAAAGTLTVETTGGVDTYGTLFDGSRTQLATNDDGGSGTNFRIERQVQAGTYYVEVRGFRPTRTGAYELRVSAADDAGGGGAATTFGSGDTISSLPSGDWFPDVTSGGSFSSSGGDVSIQLNNGGYIEEGDYRYTCQSAGGCAVRNGSVQSGTIAQTSRGTAPGDGDSDGGMAAQFDLHDDNDAPRGLTFANGRFYVPDYWDEKVYAYTASGARDATADFDLNTGSSFDGASGIAHANDRFYVVHRDDEMVYAYTAQGARDATADFDLANDNANPRGIAHVNGRLYVTDGVDRKVYAYTVSGVRDPAAEFNLHGDNGQPADLVYANARFFVVDWRDNKVYGYTDSGARDPAVDLDLNLRNGYEGYGIAYASDRIYVVEQDDTVSGPGNGDRVRSYPAPTGGNGTGSDTQPRFAAGSGPGNQTYTVGTAISALSLPTAGGGDGPLTYSLSPQVPGLIFNATASVRRLSGTPTSAGTYDMTYRVRDTDGDTDSLTFTITVTEPGPASPDLTVGSPSVSDSAPSAGASFTLSATVRNGGDASAAATTLRYYRSTNATISMSDAAVGTDAVGALAASGTSAESISLTAPSSAGTYYYGACVDSVAGESDTDNNCSTGVRVSVSGGGTGGGGDGGCVEVNDVVELGEGESCTITQALVDKYSLSRVSVRAGGTARCSGGRVRLSFLSAASIQLNGLTIRCR